MDIFGRAKRERPTACLFACLFVYSYNYVTVCPRSAYAHGGGVAELTHSGLHFPSYIRPSLWFEVLPNIIMWQSQVHYFTLSGLI